MWWWPSRGKDRIGQTFLQEWAGLVKFCGNREDRLNCLPIGQTFFVGVAGI